MIRINLLPQKKRAQRPEGSQLWMVVIMVLFLGEVAGLFVYHGSKAEELNTQKRTNAALQGQIDHAKKAVANHAQVKAALATLRAREKAIAALQRARTGPTAMMLELARILTPGRGPSVAPEKLNEIRRDNPLADFQPQLGCPAVVAHAVRGGRTAREAHRTGARWRGRERARPSHGSVQLL